VRFTPPQPLVGHDLAIQVLEIAPRAAPDVVGNLLVLPVGIAEVDLGTVVPLASPPGSIPPTCSDDLLTIDRKPVSIRVTGDVGANYDGRLDIATCDGAPLVLTAGSHTVFTVPGLTFGIDLDQLALVSPQFTAAPPAPADAAPTVASSSEHHATIGRADDSFWLTLNQSFNRGWEATAHHADEKSDLGVAHPIGAFANGWFVSDPNGEATRVDFTWTPQRSVDLALLVSGLGVLACVALVIFRRRRAPASIPETPAPAPQPFRVPRAPLVASAVVVVAGVLFGSPLIGAALLLFAVGATFAPRSRVLAAIVTALPIAAIVTAVGLVLWKQQEYDYPHDARWPSYFGGAHALVLFGFLALALLVVAERDEDLKHAE
jgi:hypothetical protein